MKPPSGKKYSFSHHNGYLIDPRYGSNHSLVSIGHTAGISPWSDPGLHHHSRSEEIYLLLNGKLNFVVGKARLDLHERELLLVRSGVPHAIADGEGKIEHIGLRAPALEDKINLGEFPTNVYTHSTSQRELIEKWGVRLSTKNIDNQNRWLLGGGTARVHSEYLSLAYLNFPNKQTANAGIGTRHRPHYHTRCWEYYLVIAGKKTLQVGDELVTITAGEMLEVPPCVPHSLYSREAPFEGLTVRAPVALEDKVEIN